MINIDILINVSGAKVGLLIPRETDEDLLLFTLLIKYFRFNVESGIRIRFSESIQFKRRRFSKQLKTSQKQNIL